jgi:CRP-like cAMP-binding protein
MSRDRDVEAHIAEVDLFRALSKGQVKRLAAAAKEVTHPPGKAVSTEGQGGLAFHYILDGSATVSQDGRELRTLGPGDYFGEISLIDGQPRSASVVADGELRTLYIPREEFSSLLDQHPEISRALLMGLCARLRAVERA